LATIWFSKKPESRELQPEIIVKIQLLRIFDKGEECRLLILSTIIGAMNEVNLVHYARLTLPAWQANAAYFTLEKMT